HDGGGLAALSSTVEGPVGIVEGSLGIAKQPQGPCPIGQDHHTDILAKSRRQPTMLGRIVERDCLIIVCPTLGDVSRAHQRSAHEAMHDHEWDRYSLFLSERAELYGETEQIMAVPHA